MAGALASVLLSGPDIYEGVSTCNYTQTAIGVLGATP